MRRAALAGAVAALAALPAGASAAAPPVTVSVTADTITLENGLIERSWSRAQFRTRRIRDLRSDTVWSRDVPDFALGIDGAGVGSARMSVSSVSTARLADGGARVTIHLTGIPGVAADRVAELHPGVAGMRMQTILTPSVPLPVSGVTLEQAAPPRAVAPTLQAFRAGADWRDPEYTGPQYAIGDKHPGTWRVATRAGKGSPIDAAGEYLSLADGDRSLFMVDEGTDFPSQRGRYDGTRGALRALYSYDVILLGPIEETAHIEHPLGGPGRHRVLPAGVPTALDPVFVGVSDHDGDEAWQWHKRFPPAQQGVVFNSDKLDSNAISTGAKDDTNLAMVKQVAPIARDLGADTFVLDDGWQEVSGDWVPDPKRFPDDHFAAVRDAIAPMKLGLWMSPGHFFPTSKTFAAHPDWLCQPVGSALLAYNQAQPEDSSNEAGIVPWGPNALGHVESRIRLAIESWQVRYFKFDFLAWLDCAAQGDLYAFRDAFTAMLDRLRADHPEVTFEIDETNDYRLFPFASTTRGPTWFQNGAPDTPQLLHNLWNLSPYVPAYDIGQHVLGGDIYKRHPLDTVLAASLPTQVTLYTDIRKLPTDVVSRARTWFDFYSAHRRSFAGVTYPLLADPLGKRWTALQTWNPERGRGALLAFRQLDGADSKRIALRNVPDGQTFRLRSAPDGADLGTVTSAELQDGLEVTIPESDGAAVILIDRCARR